MSNSEPARSRRQWLPWAAAGTALVVGGVVGGVIVAATGSSGSSNSPAQAPGSSTVSACAVTSVASEVVPSVVTIAASAPGGAGTGTGSGEVIRPDGYILTNNHVISIAASGGSVEVLFADGATAPATITGRDPQTDLAVLKVQPSHQLKVIQLGSSSSVKVGQPVVAIGAPLGLSGTAEQARVPEGLYVQAVAPGGPAAQAGLRPGDVITSIDGKPATSNIQLQELTLTKKPGDTVPVAYSRNGQSAKTTVTLGAQPWPRKYRECHIAAAVQDIYP